MSVNNETHALINSQTSVVNPRPKPFKFHQFFMKQKEYRRILKEIWEERKDGKPVYNLCAKLNELKTALKQLNKKSFSDISQRVTQAQEILSAT